MTDALEQAQGTIADLKHEWNIAHSHLENAKARIAELEAKNRELELGREEGVAEGIAWLLTRSRFGLNATALNQLIAEANRDFEGIAAARRRIAAEVARELSDEGIDYIRMCAGAWELWSQAEFRSALQRVLKWEP